MYEGIYPCQVLAITRIQLLALLGHRDTALSKHIVWNAHR